MNRSTSCAMRRVIRDCLLAAIGVLTLAPTANAAVSTSWLKRMHFDIRRHLFKVPVDMTTVKALTAGTGLEWSPVICSAEPIEHASISMGENSNPLTLGPASMRGARSPSPF